MPEGRKILNVQKPVVELPKRENLPKFTKKQLAEHIYDLYIEINVADPKNGVGKDEWVRRMLNGAGAAKPAKKDELILQLSSILEDKENDMHYIDAFVEKHGVDRLRERVALVNRFSYNTLETELDARDDTAIPDERNASLSSYATSSLAEIVEEYSAYKRPYAADVVKAYDAAATVELNYRKEVEAIIETEYANRPSYMDGLVYHRIHSFFARQRDEELEDLDERQYKALYQSHLDGSNLLEDLGQEYNANFDGRITSDEDVQRLIEQYTYTFYSDVLIDRNEPTQEENLKAYVDNCLKEIKWLSGRLSGFTEDEISDLVNDLKPWFENSTFVGSNDDFDDWYDEFSEEQLLPLLNERRAENAGAKTSEGYFGKDNDGNAYYRIDNLNESTLKEVQVEAEQFIIAGRVCTLPKSTMEGYNIQFIEIGRDINDEDFILSAPLYLSESNLREIMKKATFLRDENTDALYLRETKYGSPVNGIAEIPVGSGKYVAVIDNRQQKEDAFPEQYPPSFIIAHDYNPNKGEWQTGAFGFSHYEEARDYYKANYNVDLGENRFPEPKTNTKNSRAALKTAMQKEFDDFRAAEFKKSASEVFADMDKIRFFTEVSNFLTNDEKIAALPNGVVNGLLSETPNTLNLIYDFSVRVGGYGLESAGQVQALINDYSEDYYPQTGAAQTKTPEELLQEPLYGMVYHYKAVAQYNTVFTREQLFEEKPDFNPELDVQYGDFAADKQYMIVKLNGATIEETAANVKAFLTGSKNDVSGAAIAIPDDWTWKTVDTNLFTGEYNPTTKKLIEHLGLSDEDLRMKEPEQDATYKNQALDIAKKTKEPTVVILKSDNSELKAGQIIPLSKAEVLLPGLNKAFRDSFPDYSDYDEVSLSIQSIINGQPNGFDLTYEIGNENGGIIDHIQNDIDYTDMSSEERENLITYSKFLQSELNKSEVKQAAAQKQKDNIKTVLGGKYNAEELQKYLTKELEANALKNEQSEKQFISFLGSFRSRQYSVRNQLMLYLQAYINGYTPIFGTFEEWKGKGTSIQPGTHGLTICRPIFTDVYYEDVNVDGEIKKQRYVKFATTKEKLKELEEGVKAGTVEKKSELTHFIYTDSVFSMSQTTMTEDQRIEYLQRYNALNTSTENAELYEKMKVIAAELGRPVVEKPIKGEALGWVERKAGGEIVIKEDMPVDAKISVLAHEIGHKLLHIQNATAENRAQKEVQAQLFSHLAMLKLGIDAEKQFSLSYINNWIKADEKNPPVFDADGRELSKGEVLQLNLAAVIPAVDAMLKAVGEKKQPIDTDALQELKDYKADKPQPEQRKPAKKEGKVEIEPLRVVKETDKAVMVKIPGANPEDPKKGVWLPRSRISVNKEGYVYEATPSLIQEKGLTPKATLTAGKGMKVQRSLKI